LRTVCCDFGDELLFRSSGEGIKLLSHSFIMAVAVRLMLLGVKLFISGQGITSPFDGEEAVLDGSSFGLTLGP
jgi:hypothetical protein